MILSPDVVSTLERHSGDIKRGHWDDIDFGKIALQQGIPSTPAPRCDPRSREAVDVVWDLCHHYYLKHVVNGVRNVQTEIDIMKYLISKIYRI